MSCPGTTYCGHALVNTHALEKALRVQVPDTKNSTIRISGCPNRCAQSGVADIGLTGKIRKDDDGNRVEGFIVVTGGGMGKTPALAEKSGQICIIRSGTAGLLKSWRLTLLKPCTSCIGREPSMKWNKKALDRLEAVPVPPVMARYAKLDAEMRAQRKGLEEVTTDIVLETEKGYLQAFGTEAVETIKAMSEGKDAGLPDEFYQEDPDELYSINLCPAKYGACTAEKRDLMRDILIPLRKKLQGAEHHADNNGQVVAAADVPSFFYHRHYRLPELLPVTVLF